MFTDTNLWYSRGGGQWRVYQLGGVYQNTNMRWETGIAGALAFDMKNSGHRREGTCGLSNDWLIETIQPWNGSKLISLQAKGVCANLKSLRCIQSDQFMDILEFLQLTLIGSFKICPKIIVAR